MTYWKIALIAAFLAFYGAIVWHVKNEFDQADQKAALETQIENAAKQQAEIQTVATATEAALAAERQKTAVLTQKRIAYHEKAHTSCKLPASAIVMLKDATKPANDLPR